MRPSKEVTEKKLKLIAAHLLDLYKVTRWGSDAVTVTTL
jgi:hypothetical protein